jgi:hypothetical protein
LLDLADFLPGLAGFWPDFSEKSCPSKERFRGTIRFGGIIGFGGLKGEYY